MRLCQIDCLAVRLLEGLQHWPYVLDIITMLGKSCLLVLRTITTSILIATAYNVTVRDALIKHEPYLLNDVVVQATKSENGHSKYTAAAVALLSHPGKTLPSAVQTLFLRLVDRAAQHPSAATVKHVLSMLRGTSTLLLGLLSNEALLCFEEKLHGILHDSARRPSHEPADELLTLRCLAIMKLVATAADDQLIVANSFYQTQELLASTQPASPKWNAAEMRKFFTCSSNAPKTIKLLVLRTMWASQAGKESLVDRKETLNLVNEIVAAIPVELKDLWCSSNTAYVQKLQHKALSCDMDDCLKLQTFGFVTQLCKPVFLHMSVVESIRQAISQPDLLAQACSHAVDAAWSHCVVAVLDSRTVETLLQRLLSFLAQAGPGGIVEGSRILAQLIQRLRLLAVDHQDITEAAIAALSTPTSLQQLQELTKSVRAVGYTSSSAAPVTTVCGSLEQDARRRLSLDLSHFLLTSALNGQENGRTILPPVSGLLLELYAVSVQSSSECSHIQSDLQHAERSPAFIEHESTPVVSTMGQ